MNKHQESAKGDVHLDILQHMQGPRSKYGQGLTVVTPPRNASQHRKQDESIHYGLAKQRALEQRLTRELHFLASSENKSVGHPRHCTPLHKFE